MSFISRLATAINAFWVTWSQSESDTPLAIDYLGWADYKQRLARYAMYEAYCSNVAYDDVYKAAAARKIKYKLYTDIRGIYNPADRLVSLLASYIYGGSLDRELKTGAVPIRADNEAIYDASWRVMQWSRWGIGKSQFVRMGAKLGDAPIKIVDAPARGKVRLELLDPRKLRDVEFDEVGNVRNYVIEYEREDPDAAPAFAPRQSYSAARTVLYTEIYNKDTDTISLYKDGEPYAWDGVDDWQWGTGYGFAPLVIGGHMPSDARWNKCAFYGVLRKIDEVNDFASLMGDQLRKTVVPIWVATGVNNAPDSVKPPDRDAMPLLKLPKDATITPMVAPLNLADALANLREMLLEIERDMPELALQRVREKSGDTSLPAVRAQYSDAIGRIEEARGNYDDATVRALQMAITIGGIRRYPGFEGFNELSYQRGDLDMSISERPVIADQLSKSEKLTALATTARLPGALQIESLLEIGYSREDAETIVGSNQLEKDTAARAAVRGLTTSLFGNQDMTDHGDQAYQDNSDQADGTDTGTSAGSPDSSGTSDQQPT